MKDKEILLDDIEGAWKELNKLLVGCKILGADKDGIYVRKGKKKIFAVIPGSHFFYNVIIQSGVDFDLFSKKTRKDKIQNVRVYREGDFSVLAVFVSDFKFTFAFDTSTYNSVTIRKARYEDD